jgi:hypothetical protein
LNVVVVVVARKRRKASVDSDGNGIGRGIVVFGVSSCVYGVEGYECVRWQ